MMTTTEGLGTIFFSSLFPSSIWSSFSCNTGQIPAENFLCKKCRKKSTSFRRTAGSNGKKDCENSYELITRGGQQQQHYTLRKNPKRKFIFRIFLHRSVPSPANFYPHSARLKFHFYLVPPTLLEFRKMYQFAFVFRIMAMHLDLPENLPHSSSLSRGQSQLPVEIMLQNHEPPGIICGCIVAK